MAAAAAAVGSPPPAVGGPPAGSAGGGAGLSGEDGGIDGCRVYGDLGDAGGGAPVAPEDAELDLRRLEEAMLERDDDVDAGYGRPDDAPVGDPGTAEILGVASDQSARCPVPCLVAPTQALRLTCEGGGGFSGVGFMSWNVRCGAGPAGRAALEAAIAASMPHIVALQEWDIEAQPPVMSVGGRAYAIPDRLLEELRGTGRAGGHAVLFLRDDVGRLVQSVASRSVPGVGHFARATVLVGVSGRCHAYSGHAPVNGAEGAWAEWWEDLSGDMEGVAASDDVVLLIGDHNFSPWGDNGYTPPRGPGRRAAVDAARREDYVVAQPEWPGPPVGTCRADPREDRAWCGASAYDFPVWRNAAVRDFRALGGWEFGSDHRMVSAVADFALPAEYAAQFCWRRGIPRRGQGQPSGRYQLCCRALARAVLRIDPGPGGLAAVHGAMASAAEHFAVERTGGRLGDVDVFLQRLRGWFVVCAALGRRQAAGLAIDLVAIASVEARARLGAFLEWLSPLEHGGPLSWGARASRLEAWLGRTETAVRSHARDVAVKRVAEGWHDMRLHFGLIRERMGSPVPQPVGMIRLSDGTLSTDPTVVRGELAACGGYQATPAFPGAVAGSVDHVRREAALAVFSEAVRQWVPRPAPFRPRHLPGGGVARDATSWLRRELTREEFDKALFRKMGMAAGDDLLTQEVLCDMPEDARSRLFALVRDHWATAWRGGRWRYPDAMKHVWQAPIPKKGYDGSSARLRFIAVSSILARIYNRPIYERMYWHLEESGCLSKLQGGFRSLFSTASPMARVQEYISGGPAHLAPLDLRRAFDSVELPFAGVYLDHADVPEGDFPILRGCKMGAIETPILFDCLMDPLLHLLERRFPGALVNAYADDLLLGHRDPVILARMVGEVVDFISCIGGEVNWSKSWWLSVRCDPPSAELLGRLRLVGAGESVIYLGFRLDGSGVLRPGRSVLQILRQAAMALPRVGQTGRWASRYAMSVAAGHVLYYGAFAPYSTTDLAELTRGVLRVVRKCCRLPYDAPRAQLVYPRWVDGVVPMEVVYAAAVVAGNLRLVVADEVAGVPRGQGRLAFLRRTAGAAWPRQVYFAAPMGASPASPGEGLRFLWAVAQLGLVCCQAAGELDASVAFPVWVGGDAPARAAAGVADIDGLRDWAARACRDRQGRVTDGWLLRLREFGDALSWAAEDPVRRELQDGCLPDPMPRPMAVRDWWAVPDGGAEEWRVGGRDPCPGAVYVGPCWGKSRRWFPRGAAPVRVDLTQLRPTLLGQGAGLPEVMMAVPPVVLLRELVVLGGVAGDRLGQVCPTEEWERRRPDWARPGWFNVHGAGDARAPPAPSLCLQRVEEAVSEGGAVFGAVAAEWVIRFRWSAALQPWAPFDPDTDRKVHTWRLVAVGRGPWHRIGSVLVAFTASHGGDTEVLVPCGRQLARGADPVVDAANLLAWAAGTEGGGLPRAWVRTMGVVTVVIPAVPTFFAGVVAGVDEGKGRGCVGWAGSSVVGNACAWLRFAVQGMLLDAHLHALLRVLRSRGAREEGVVVFVDSMAAAWILLAVGRGTALVHPRFWGK
eukprot:gene18494-9789_t